MSRDIRQASQATITVYPAERMLVNYTAGADTLPTCTLLDPQGATLATLDVTPDTFAAEVAASPAPTRTTGTWDAGYNPNAPHKTVPVPGMRYDITRGNLDPGDTPGSRPYGRATLAAVTHTFVQSAVTVAAVTLDTPLPETMADNDIVRAVGLSVTLSATHTATLGVGYRLVFRGVSGVTPYTDQLEHVEAVNVVRQPFAPPATAATVLAQLGKIFPSHGLSPTAAAEIAEQACTAIRQRLLGTGNYAHVYGDADTFRDAGQRYTTLLLARQHGHFPSYVQDQAAWLKDAEAAARNAVGDAIDSLTLTDVDEDGDVAVTDEKPAIGTITLRRVGGG